MRKTLTWLAGGSLTSLLLYTLIGICLGSGAYTIYYAEGLSYLSSDPKACVNCHIMRESYDGWQKGSHHAAATCVDCHLPHDFIGKWMGKVEHGYRHSKGFTLQDFHEPIRVHQRSADTLQANCVQCHQDFLHQVKIDATTANQGMKCTHCHIHVGHGPTR